MQKPRWKSAVPWVHLCLIAAVGFLSYVNVFHVPFQFDDQYIIAENYSIRDLGSFLRFWPAGDNGGLLADRRYLGMLSFALNYRFQGLDVTGYHVVNLAIHVINAMLVYFLVKFLLTLGAPFFRAYRSLSTAMSHEPSATSYQPSPMSSEPSTTSYEPSAMSSLSSPMIALFSALLFAVHPVQTQAVTYIVQRFTSLAALFSLLAMVAYCGSRTLERRGWRPVLYGVSLLSVLCAMRTKEIAFTLPVMIGLVEFLFFEGRAGKRMLRLIPFLLTMLIIPLGLIGIDRPIGEAINDIGTATRVSTAMPRWDYLLTQFSVVVTYLRLLLLPVNQNLDYDYPIYSALFDPPVLLSFLFLSLLLILAVYLLRLSFRPLIPSPQPQLSNPQPQLCLRLIAFGIFWFFIALSVESSFIPIVDVIVEHRLYLPSVGAFIAVVTGLFMAAGKLKERVPWAEKALVCALALVVIVLAGASLARNRVWHDDVTLWTDVVAKSPRKARPHNNLGLAYGVRGDLMHAVEELEQSVALDSSYGEAHANLGFAYFSLGDLDRAIDHLSRAVEANPRDGKVHLNLGLAYRKKGLNDRAEEQFLLARQLRPELFRFGR